MKILRALRPKALWTRFALRAVPSLGVPKRLDCVYSVTDPWDLGSEREAYRFSETNRIILEQFGHVHSLLEVGCGEGHQSVELARVCDRLHGIDVSGRAIHRARKKLDAEFEASDLI